MTAEPDRVAGIAQVTDHVPAGLALLTTRWREAPIAAGRDASVIVGVLGAWLGQVQEIEDALWSVLSLTLGNATGDQLAQFGALLGAANPGLADAVYRRLLRGAAAAIGSSGAADELLGVLAAVADTGDAFALTEFFPGAVKVEPEEAIAVPASALHAVLRRAVAGGVRLLTVDVPEGATFAFSATDETVTDAARGLSNVGGLVGGQLVGVIDA